MRNLAIWAMELVLVGLGAGLLAGAAGNSGRAAFAAGVAVMAALGIPAHLVVGWGRQRTNAEFLSSVFGVMLVKLVVVGAVMAFVLISGALPGLGVAWGLMAGWLVSLAVMGWRLNAHQKTMTTPRG